MKLTLLIAVIASTALAHADVEPGAVVTSGAAVGLGLEGGRITRDATDDRDEDHGKVAGVVFSGAVGSTQGWDPAAQVRFFAGYGGGGFAYDAMLAFGPSYALGPFTVAATLGAGSDAMGVGTSHEGHVGVGISGVATGFINLNIGPVVAHGELGNYFRTGTDEFRAAVDLSIIKGTGTGLHLRFNYIDYLDIGRYYGVAIGMGIGDMQVPPAPY